MVKEISILIGGKAGDGIDKASIVIAQMLSSIGYRIFVHRDYPSLIRGGHTFSIIRASDIKIYAHKEEIDILIALNAETLDKHRKTLKNKCFYIYDSEQIKMHADACGTGIPINSILKEENAPELMKNSCLLGAFGKATGISWDIIEKTLKITIPKEIDLNLKVAKKGYEYAKELISIEKLQQNSLPVLTGNEALGLGFVAGGLDAYVGYPMTPSSGLLHFLAGLAKQFGLQVIHAENEISVIMMALGFAYTGKKSAVGTSGGGFCLMNEGLSLSGMAEIPVVIVLGQRTGPSTGLPTYTGQTELFYAIHSGHGEFTRFVVSPGDCEQAYYLGAISVDIAWKYQIPSIILTDKSIAENVYSFNLDEVDQINFSQPIVWNGDEPFKRYKYTENGISPMCFVPKKEAIIKVNSYEHDEYGITTENPVITKSMQEKRVLIKEKFLLKEIENRFECVKVYGNKNSETAILCWGSNMPVCVELGKKYNLKVIQVVVLHPFPVNQFRKALEGVKRLIDIENNATGQLGNLIKSYGFSINDKILKYDGRPFSVDEIENKLKVL
ncbi:MAG TPA: 2-oxoacid:acceptor oxidoreductase subunit alpha [Candidatus Ratteibacteria bacterium]|nr:2-oxoacid:acceptor oxidoreductase subunit alpha [bacterium]HRS06231.1 2-oxoacid:acceptor oxidoreductase subunit alpha [Candidatus Ratteibacteria bacterium]HRV03957.1 2-oxoacid:acceptor oxidoreductase subunit alpha [Candidatus Ratteibacteria bacterium]